METYNLTSLTNDMLHVLALACSPEKGGNSDTLLDAFIEGMNQSEEIQIEKVYLYDIPMRLYRHEYKRPGSDEEPEFVRITESLTRANGLIIATPTYNFGVPAVLKNFIDRIGFMSLDYHKSNLFGQPTGLLKHLRTHFLVTGGSHSLVEIILFFLYPRCSLWVQFLYYGVRRISGTFAGGLSYTHPAREQLKLLKKYQQKGQHFAEKIITDNKKTPSAQVI